MTGPQRPTLIRDAYQAKGDAYFANARVDYVDSLPIDPSAAILELGCGDGATGRLALQQQKAGTYVGVEVFEPVATQAKKVLTAVHIGDIESIVLPYEPNTFDVLICSEVLEHLRDPEEVLTRLIKLLRIGGRIYASVPNIAHWRIVLGLIRGRFDYRDFGPMDRTHLQWFTPKTFVEMLVRAGIEVELVQPTGRKTHIKDVLAGLPLGHLVWSQIDVAGRRTA